MEKADVSVAKPVHTYVHGPEDCKPLWGTVTTGTYLVVWTLSLAAPFVAAGLLLSGQFRSGAALLLSIGVCYLPFWPKSPWLRKWYQGGNVGYFRRSSLLYEERLLDAAAPASTRKLLCVHPHGIFCMGWGILFGRPELDGIKFCISAALYRSPYFQLLTRTVGMPAPADKDTFQRLMREGGPMAVLPGGFEEATITCDNKHRIYIKKRMGFVKYALQAGYSIVPSYCFGENETYSNAQGFWGLRLWLNAQGMVGILPFGRWWFPLLARNRRMHIVVGKAMQLPLLEAPTKEQVAEHHARYVAALTELFERHKGSYGYAPDVQLEVW